MTQATWDTNNGSGAVVRQAIEDALHALNNSHKGASRPSYAEAGSIWLKDVSATQQELYFYDGSNDILIGTFNPTADTYRGFNRLQAGALFGLTLSNNGADALNDIDIAAGAARDSTDVADLFLTSTLTKRLDAAWAVGSGNGGLDTGSEAANTWYHLWLIRRPDTGVVDALFSLSATSPTMPANYTQKRRIGAVRNDGSSNILPFTQVGDEFLLTTSIEDVNSGTWNTTATPVTLSVPSGVKVWALFTAEYAVAGTVFGLITSPDQADVAASTNMFNMLTTTPSGATLYHGKVRTNTSSQIRARTDTTTGATVNLLTRGWVDRRGQDA